MKKHNGATACYGLSLILLIGFIITVLIDYGRYNSSLNSAPFYVWILENAMYYIVPSITSLIIGLIIDKKTK